MKEPAESCIEPQVLTGVEPNLDNPDNFHDEGSNSEDMDIEKSENEANEEFADVEMQYDDDDDDEEEEEEEEEEEDDEEDDDEEEEGNFLKTYFFYLTSLVTLLSIYIIHNR